MEDPIVNLPDTEVRLSQIASVGYNAVTRELYVWFRNYSPSFKAFQINSARQIYEGLLKVGVPPHSDSPTQELR
jgi:hypothetical protein